MLKKRNFKIPLLLSIIMFIVSFILTQVIDTEFCNHFFWFSWLCLTCFTIIDMEYWTKAGLNASVEEGKSIARKFGDGTTSLLVYHMLLFFLIILYSTYDKEIIKNNYVIIGMFIMTIIYEILNYCYVYSAKAENVKIIEKKDRKSKIRDILIGKKK